jgi:peptide/nickel transport system substrate-binding protein
LDRRAEVAFDRVEWRVISDDGTAAAALQAGEVDWWELPTNDLAPALQRAGHIRMEVTDKTGVIGLLKMNCLQPPFDKAAIRRALLGVVAQRDYVTAIAGDDPKKWRTGVGLFCPGTELANSAGIDVLTGNRDPRQTRAQIAAAGYRGETVALMIATDTTYREAMGDVGADELKSVGLSVDYQATDWGTIVQRRENKGPGDKGGWSALFTTLSGLDLQVPSGHAFRANGEKAWFGWVSSPRIEALRGAWLDAEDVASQQRIAADIQRQWWIDVPHIPIGQWFQPMAWRDGLEGMLDGFPVFWNVRRRA